MSKNIKNEMKLEFSSKSANEAFARISVAAFASQLDPTIEEIADIKTSVSEAVTNSIIHAYPSKDGIVKLRARLIGDDEGPQRGRGHCQRRASPHLSWHCG